MVCAYGPVNKCLELSTFPSADPDQAFKRAAGRKHHTVIDAIWGYTQFLLDETTSRVLTVCARSGLYQMLRMPFGPAPAPPEMQSYVDRTFGTLIDPETGEQACVPLMDDLAISSRVFPEHTRHVNIVLDRAARDRFEFKLTKGQFNQSSVVLWGFICDEHGRRPQPKQVEQLRKWPEPKPADDVRSFLAFVNYLRALLDPEWLKDEQVLKPFRKNTVDFNCL